MNFYNSKSIDRLKIALPYFLLFFIVFVLYSKTTGYEYTLFDDYALIEDNAKKYSSKSFIPDIFKNNVFLTNVANAYYRPMLTLSFALDNRIAGPSAAFSHFANVLLHCFSVFLIFFFLKKYLFLSVVPSFAVAALFAVHPLTIQTVAWIPGRNDSILLIFFLLSFIFFLGYLNNKKILFVFLHTAFLLLSLFTKESAIILPFACLLYYFLNKETFRNRMPKYLYFIWAASILFFLFTRNAVLHNSVFSAASTMLNFSKGSVITFFDYYSAALFFRAPMAANANTAVLVSGITAFGVFAFFSFYGKDKTQKTKMFFFFIMPVLFLLFVFISLRTFFQGNRAYIPLMFMLISAISFCRVLNKKFRFPKKYFFIIFIMLFVFSFVKTYTKSDYFKMPALCWQQVIKENPRSSVTIYFLHIKALIFEGNYEDALQKTKYLATIANISKGDSEFMLIQAFLLNGFYEEAAELGESYLSHQWPDKRHNVYLHLITSLNRLNKKDEADSFIDRFTVEFNYSSDEAQKYLNSFEQYIDYMHNKKRD